MTALLAGGAMFAPLGSHSAVLHSEISPDAASDNAPPLRVMNIGESVVVGHQLIPGSYRLPLRQAFIEGGCEVTFVGHNTENSPAGYDNLLRHDGERGWYIHEFTERIVGWVNSQQPERMGKKNTAEGPNRGVFCPKNKARQPPRRCDGGNPIQCRHSAKNAGFGEQRQKSALGKPS